MGNRYCPFAMRQGATRNAEPIKPDIMIMKTKRHLPILILLLPTLAAAQTMISPGDQSLFEDFESFTAGGSGSPEIFERFDTPDAVTFSGGWSGFAGVGAFYHSGVRAWMVQPQGSGASTGEGVIAFETPAANVSFFLASGDGTGEYEVFSDSGDSLFSMTDSLLTDIRPAASPDFVSLDASFLGASEGIGRIEFRSSGSPLAVDDFGYTPIPEPALAAALLASGALVVVVFVRRRRSLAKRIQ